MLDVHDGKLVVEEKGIYSIEKFIVSRRLMYWQVYLHKTSIAADHMLINVLQRAKDIVRNGRKDLEGSPSLKYFLENDISLDEFRKDDTHLKKFVQLDDIDVLQALKMWMYDEDVVLSYLSTCIIDRQLFKLKYIEVDSDEILPTIKSRFFEKHPQLKGFDEYLFNIGSVTNNAYIPGRDSISIKMKNGEIKDVAEVAEVLTIKTLSNPMVKKYICYPTL